MQQMVVWLTGKKHIMDILYLLIPLSLVLVFAIGAVFWWAINHRQFDGLEDEGQRIVNDVDA